MSKPNKVNKTNYVQRGRLTPDDMARERKPASARTSARQAALDRTVQGKRAERIKAKSAAPGASRPRSAPEE
jgi:hypothetical protein